MYESNDSKQLLLLLALAVLAFANGMLSDAREDVRMESETGKA